MATVTTFNDEAELQAAVGGTVTVFNDEAEFDAFLDTITTETVFVIAHGIKYTVVVDPTATFLANVALPIIPKGIKYTVIFDA